MTKLFGIVAIAALAITLSACKGRTMENMTPTGDTVEVVIDTPQDQAGTQAEAPVTTDTVNQ